MKKFRRYHRLLLYRVADALKNIEVETLEKINPFKLAPWKERVQTDIHEIPATQPETEGFMQTAVSTSVGNKMVGFGGAIQKQPPRCRKTETEVLFCHTRRRKRVEPVLGGVGSNSTRFEHATGTETLQDHTAHKHSRLQRPIVKHPPM